MSEKEETPQLQSAKTPTTEGLPLEESRIIIRPGGEVVIENLSALLVEVAEELDPDAEGIACRVELAKGE